MDTFAFLFEARSGMANESGPRFPSVRTARTPCQSAEPQFSKLHVLSSCAPGRTTTPGGNAVGRYISLDQQYGPLPCARAAPPESNRTEHSAAAEAGRHTDVFTRIH